MNLQTVFVNGVELHYLEQGSDAPVIFVHGALVDYRRWAAQFAPFAEHYRMIAYSRRYNFPNQNPDLRPDHSARVEADDLAAFITALQLGPVHVIGESIGASIGLWLAVRHPELVRTVVLAEPPELRWVTEVPGGAAVFDDFMHTVWEPVGQAFRAGDAERALRLSVDYYLAPGLWDELPAEDKDALWANQREWQALTTSNDAFPVLSRAEVQQLTVPTLMLTGEQTLPIHQLVNDELERLVPNGVRVRVADATHELWEEFPEQARATTLAFLANQ